jgi:uncharacterized protein YoxC
MDLHVYVHLTDESELKRKLDRIDSSLNALTEQGMQIMATLDDILNDEAQDATALGQLATAVQTLLASVTTLQTELAAALAGTTLPTAVQAKVDQAFTNSKANTATVNSILTSLAPPPPPPPVLATSFPDNPTFTAAVTAYTGPETVTLDGVTVKAGSATILAYFTHSVSVPPGAINMTGPTS